MANSGKSPAAAFVIDKIGHITSWNEECERLLGYRADEVLGKSLHLLLIPQKGRSRRTDPAEAGAGRIARRLRHKDGHDIPASLHLLPQVLHDSAPGTRIALIQPSRTASPSTQVRKFINRLPGPFYVVDEEGRFLLWNRTFAVMLGKTARQLAQMAITDCVGDTDRETVQKALREVLMQGQTMVEAHLRTRDGTLAAYMFSCSRIVLDRRICLCAMGVEIPSRAANGERLSLRERAIQSSFSGVVITRCTDHGNVIEYVNPAFERITGYSEQELLGRDPGFMRAPNVDLPQTEKIRAALRAREGTHVVMRNLRKNGEIYWNDLKIDPVENPAGRVTHYVGLITDVTEFKQSEKHLAYMASHDPLTGLANRTLMREHLELAIMQAHRYRTLVAVVFIDLDNFKVINDTLGHDAGDEVLKTIAARLRANVRESDIVARLGGDEFVLVLASQPSVDSITDLIERLHHNVREAMPHIGDNLQPTLSAGISLYPHDGKSVEALMRNADAAMYHAKSLGRNNYQFYSAELHAAANSRLKQEAHLRQAIEGGQLFLLFQPRINCRTGVITGAEALVRWQHPEKGVLTPKAFLPLAEETGLILAIGDWVLEEACKAIQQFRAMDLPDFCISINLSARQLKQKGYLEKLAQQLARTGLPPDWLELELTENQLMDNPEHSVHLLHQLKALGVRIAIDDFGSGFSSLSILEKLPIDRLKIDASFVHDIGHDDKQPAIATAVIALGHSLKATVIAEGVETEDQYRFLRQHDCDEMQGYYVSEPIIARPLKTMLRKSGRPAH